MVNDSLKISVKRQSELLGLNRSSLYYKSIKDPEKDKVITREMLDIYEKNPEYGYRRITKTFQKRGVNVNNKKILRLMRQNNIKAIHPGPNTSKRNHADAVVSYLLKDLKINNKNQVWQVDITYIRVQKGFMYLFAVIDVYSRKILSWRLNNSMDSEFCITATSEAISQFGKPHIINSDQGSQFTGNDWKKLLQDSGVSISMNGKGRSNDNAFIERFWRSLKQENLSVREFANVRQLRKSIKSWICEYNSQRPHQSLDYKVPDEVFYGNMDNLKKLPTLPQNQ